MTAPETWRDDASIVWQDEDGGRCLRVVMVPTGWSVTIGEPGRTFHAWVPGTYRSEVAERFLAALGLTADNLRLAPEPIKVGDRVTGHPSYEWGEVIGIHDGRAWVYWRGNGRWYDTHHLDDLTRVDSSPSPEPEGGEYAGTGGEQ